MNGIKRYRPLYLSALAAGLLLFAGCVAEMPIRPTLDEARAGKTPQEGDSILRPGEVRAEVVEVDPPRREIRVVWTDGGRRDMIPYDTSYTRVVYHGWEYPPASLEAGDIVAFVPPPGGGRPYVDTIRVQIPVQARATSTIARSIPLPRSDVVEGTVERIDYDRGVFDVRPRSGRMVTVTLPYNARGSDIDNFRRIRRGDYVRVQGEFLNADNLQLLAFLEPVR